MDNKIIEKTLDVVGNAAKLGANLTEAKKEKPNPKPVPQTDDNSNKASQNIQIALDTGKKKEPKPIEKHIHTFPENRPLTSEECELDLKKAQMEYELKKSEQQFAIEIERRNWMHQMEQEKKNEKKGKIRRIIGGILVAIGVSTVGYSVYADYRDHRNQQVAPPALPAPEPVKTEGEVK